METIIWVVLAILGVIGGYVVITEKQGAIAAFFRTVILGALAIWMILFIINIILSGLNMEPFLFSVFFGCMVVFGACCFVILGWFLILKRVLFRGRGFGRRDSILYNTFQGQHSIRLDAEDSLFNAIVATRREQVLSEVEILAIAYHSGNSVPKDEQKAYDILVAAAEQGDINAFQYCQIAAEAGHARGQYLLGLCYLDGKGVPADSARALQLFHQSAEQGNADAQCQLGYVYRDALFGIERDIETALHWFKLAAAQGDLAARWSLALHFAPDDGTESSKDRAFRILKEVAQELTDEEKVRINALLTENGYDVL